MFTIEGKHGSAVCYAVNIEDACVDQVRAMLDMPFAEGANTAIMPDAHYGIGCTIGTTMKVTDAVVPNLMGVDIGCGMLTADLGRVPISLPVFDDACHEVPSGTRVCEATIDEVPAACKPVDDIIGPISDAVDIVDVMRPVYNFKAS